MHKIGEFIYIHVFVKIFYVIYEFISAVLFISAEIARYS